MSAPAEPWSLLWLNYRPVEETGEAEGIRGENRSLMKRIQLRDFSPEHPVIRNAGEELSRGLQGLLGILPTGVEEEPGMIMKRGNGLGEEGYRIIGEGRRLTLEAGSERGILYGVFEILRKIALGCRIGQLNLLCEPDNPLRMLNHWDNGDGSIERGYAGTSFFFEEGELLVGERTRDYARLIASVGINGVVINNVNVKGECTRLLSERFYPKLARLGTLFESYGIRLFLSLNFAAPMESDPGEMQVPAGMTGYRNNSGGKEGSGSPWCRVPGIQDGPGTADPLDERVILWWRKKMAEAFERIPGLGGFLVKADSEGRPGPFTYGRSHAQGANMLADAIKPYGGVLIWRCFVYNCTQDWRDTRTDRARAAYDHFQPTDGEYRENVILQIKNGPMDFQIREPVSPLFGSMPRTNQMLEVQIAQEYTGQQIDLCYLIPMFKEVLDFRVLRDNREFALSGAVQDGAVTVADVVSGRTFGHRNCGIAAVSNTGRDANWTGHWLAAANLYGFGRLAFQTALSAEEIAREWAGLTFGGKRNVAEAVTALLLGSRETYEKYTAPLGIGWMVSPESHYGPSVDGYEYSRWGTYHRADHLGLGVDRTRTGTGYVDQYPEPLASLYNDPRTCPEELLLFFHHLPYSFRLKNGRTVLEHIYAVHDEGVAEVEEMIRIWESLEGKIPEEIHGQVCQRFCRQLDNAREWRDQVKYYFFRKSGIPFSAQELAETPQEMIGQGTADKI